MLQILADLESQIDEDIEWGYFYEIMAHLSETIKIHRLLAISEQMIDFINRSLSAHPPAWQFLLNDFSAYTLSLNASITGPLTFANNFKISFDSSFYSANANSTLRLAFVDYNIFLAVTPDSNRTLAPIAILTL